MHPAGCKRTIQETLPTSKKMFNKSDFITKFKSTKKKWKEKL